MYLVTDSLHRTCTGTIIIDIEGFGGPGTQSSTDGSTNTNTGTHSDGTKTTEDVTTPDIYAQTSTPNDLSGGRTTGGGREPYVNGRTFSDNVHFGPAGIGLLIMGFLVLGCKYFNNSVYMWKK